LGFAKNVGIKWRKSLKEKELENIDNCPICGGFLYKAGSWVSYPLVLRRVDCNKCGTAFRSVNLEERFRLIRMGKTKEEREDIAFHT